MRRMLKTYRVALTLRFARIRPPVCWIARADRPRTHARAERHWRPGPTAASQAGGGVYASEACGLFGRRPSLFRFPPSPSAVSASLAFVAVAWLWPGGRRGAATATEKKAKQSHTTRAELFSSSRPSWSRWPLRLPTHPSPFFIIN
jgi:hypothetical protein